jgi:CAAX protease family protein
MLSEALEALFVLSLAAGVPVLSYLSTRETQIRSLPRRMLYRSAVLSQVALAALCLGTARVTSRSVPVFGAISAATLMGWTSLLTATSLGVMGIILALERRGWWPRESDLVYLLVPETGAEKLWGVLLVAPAAALCEEFVYRGYLLATLPAWLHSVSWSWVLASVIFGLAHAYQGPGGVARAALLGAWLAYPVLRLGNLYPSIAAHFLLDAAALGWLGPRLLRGRQVARC